MNSWEKPFVLWVMSRNAGKALALDTPIPTPKGFTTMGELKVGDYVLDENGEPTKINYVSDVFLGHDCYEITFSDGEKIVADADHLWNHITQRGVTKTTKTKDMIDDYKRLRTDKKFYDYKYLIPRAKPIAYQEKELMIDPYLLGYWLGDGNSADTRITCGYEDIDEIVGYIREKNYKTEIFHNKNRAPYFNVGTTPKGQDNVFLNGLKYYDLINNKHIPNDYVYSSIEQRKELLRGVLDADGHIDKNSRVEIAQKNLRLINNISSVLRSLGIDNRVKEKRIKNNNGEIVTYYRINFTVDKANDLFKLKRKRERIKENTSRKKYKRIWNIKKEIGRAHV